MKKTVHILVAIIMGLLASVQLSAQCIPDTVSCVDTTGLPGEFCPLDLPDAGLNILYDETITVIPPGDYVIEGMQMTILQIRIDSVTNMPAGIDYFPNAEIFFPDTAYCIQLTGTPTEVGVDTLAIYITATVDLFGGIEYQVVDDTSVVITVVEVLGKDPHKVTEFQVFQNAPNPFAETTRLAFYTPYQEKVELYIYNILGSLMHHESELAAPGTHNFSFNGGELQPGTYLYRVKIREKNFTGKLMKSR